MRIFQVLEQDEGIEQAILKGLACRPCTPPVWTNDSPALVVFSMQGIRQLQKYPMSCKAALLPSAAGDHLASVRAASAVSYGLSARDTLTISSRVGDKLMLALQREVVTVQGTAVEQQEFAVHCPPQFPQLSLLAVVGGLILLGAEPISFENGFVF